MEYPIIDEIMTVKEVSDFLKICRVNSYNLFNKSDFPCFFIGRSMRVKKQDLLDYIDKNMKKNN